MKPLRPPFSFHAIPIAIVLVLFTTRVHANRDAAKTTAASFVRENADFDPIYGPVIDGPGLQVSIFDLVSILREHSEFWDNATDRNSRIIPINDTDNFSAGGLFQHATHIAGTVGGGGFTLGASYRGMAPKVTMLDHNIFRPSDVLQYGMSYPGEPGKSIIMSASIGGWARGEYEPLSAELDDALVAIPYTLPFFAVGNDGQSSSGNEQFNRPIQWRTTAKNAVSVGSSTSQSRDANGNLLNPRGVVSSSSRGPADDGRIVPTIVSQGADVASANRSRSADSLEKGIFTYVSMSGTSMAQPSAAGSAVLLQDYYNKRFPGQFMRAATLKTLIIHGADDLELTGPDYRSGWGLMNTLASAKVIKSYANHPSNRKINEEVMNNQEVHTYSFYHSGSGVIRATLGWADPGGVPGADDDRIPDLVNDLNLRIISPSGVEHYPWVMPYVLNGFKSADYATPAVRENNYTDNTEQVLIDTPGEAGVWTVKVSHVRNLKEGPQPYSLILDGPEESTQTGFGVETKELFSLLKLEAEDYDSGGQGVGYNDTTAGNAGGQYRTDGVDIETCLDTGGGYHVGSITDGEWLAYTIDVAQSGDFEIAIQYAARNSGGSVHIERNGVAVTGAIALPSTGGWQSWRSVYSPKISLPAGTHTLKVIMTSPGESRFNLNWFKIVEATDLDNDGLIDSWEQQIVDASLADTDPENNLADISAVLPGDDFDNDGISNADEQTAGTNPTVPEGMLLWLKPEQGVVVDGNSDVTTWQDASGSGNHMTPVSTGKPRLTSDTVGPITRAALRFTRSELDTLRTTFNQSLNMGAFTVSFAIKPSAVSNYSQTISSSGWNTFQFHTANGGPVYVGTDTASRMTPSNLPAGTLQPGKWHIITFSFDQGKAAFYKNGILLYSKSGMTLPQAWTQFVLGVTDSANNALDGLIGEVAVYNRALHTAGGAVLPEWHKRLINKYLYSDNDNDGHPDWWEQQIVDASLADTDPDNNLANIAAVLPGADLDKDGISNLDEYRAGSNPMVPEGMLLWLKPEQGVVVDANNDVTTWQDASGLGNLMTPSSTGKPRLTSDTIGTATRPALQFNKTELDALRTTFIKPYDMSAFTVSFAIKPATLANYAQQIASTGWGRFVFHSASNGSVYVGTDTTTRMTNSNLPAGTIQTGNWQIITFSFNQGQAAFYKNGVLLFSKSGMTLPSAWTEFLLGLTDNANNAIDGLVGEVAVYNRALHTAGGTILTDWHERLMIKYLNFNPDSDNDGLPDAWEQQIVNANPSDAIRSIADVRPTDDFDGDGSLNIFEYAFKSDPTSSASHHRVQASIQQVSGIDYLSIVYRQLIGGSGVHGVNYTHNGITWTVQQTNNLTAAWNEGSTYVEVMGNPVANGDGTETVTLRSKSALGAQSKDFLRLRLISE